MDTQQFAILAGALLALVGAYVPGFNTWFEKLDNQTKQLVMLAGCFVVIAGKFGLGCIGKDATFVCTWDGAYDAAVAFVLTAAVNAGTYTATSYIGKKGATE